MGRLWLRIALICRGFQPVAPQRLPGQGEGALHNVTRGAGRVPVPVAPLPQAELPGAQSDPADSFRFPRRPDISYVHRSETTVSQRVRTTAHGRWMPTSSFSLRQQGTATHASSPDHGPLRGLPGAIGNHRRRARRFGAKLDGNRRVGILGERTQRRRAIGA
jgi:hypothetical protein